MKRIAFVVHLFVLDTKLNIFFLNCTISQRSWSVLNHVFGKLKLIYARNSRDKKRQVNSPVLLASRLYLTCIYRLNEKYHMYVHVLFFYFGDIYPESCKVYDRGYDCVSYNQHPSRWKLRRGGVNEVLFGYSRDFPFQLTNITVVLRTYILSIFFKRYLFTFRPWKIYVRVLKTTVMLVNWKGKSREYPKSTWKPVTQESSLDVFSHEIFDVNIDVMDVRGRPQEFVAL
jgi:hypothetical protein